MSAEVRVSVRATGPLAPAAAARLARRVLAAEHVRDAAVSLTFVGPRRIRSLNEEFLGHDWATDVIAFQLGSRPLVGDVYVCPAVAARNARRLGVRAGDEVRRLVVHGLLHLLGYDHPDGEHRTRSAMWRRQERYLERFGR